MDYDRNHRPIERDEAPTDHFTYADGVSRAEVNGDQYKKLRADNFLKIQTAKHVRQSRTS